MGRTKTQTKSHTSSTHIHSQSYNPNPNPSCFASQYGSDPHFPISPVDRTPAPSPAFCMTIPEFSCDEWHVTRTSSQSEKLQISQAIVPYSPYSVCGDTTSTDSQSTFSFAEGEVISDEEDYESFENVWETNKKRVRMTIIKEHTIKIRAEESDLKRVRTDYCMSQKADEVLSHGEDINMSESNNAAVPDDLSEERGKMHVHQDKGKRPMQEQELM